MNVVSPRDHDLRGASDALSSPAISPMLDRAALATGAAERRARAAAIEADIDHACEAAALRPHLCSSTASRRAYDRSSWERRSWDRRSWGGRTWNRYVAEAVRQARTHAAELERLRREAAQLDRLLQAARPPSCRLTAGGIAPP